MEHLTHQQNLAHCRRLLAEAELATSSDEIRHSMLMKLLAEEEANGLVMPVAVIVLPGAQTDPIAAKAPTRCSLMVSNKRAR